MTPLRPTTEQLAKWCASEQQESLACEIYAAGYTKAIEGMVQEWGVWRAQDENVLICESRSNAERIASGVLRGPDTMVVTSYRTSWKGTGK